MRKAGKLDAIETALSALRISMGRCTDDVRALQSGFAEIDSRLRYVEYKTIDLEATSRQNNLLFHGLPETNRYGEYEDVEALIREFIVNLLKMEAGNTMDLQSVYRLGSVKRYDSGRSDFGIRPIIVVFKDYIDAETVIDQARALKGTRYAISRDYPRELNDARKKLLPMMKQARQARQAARILYPAKLVINGEVTRDEFPGWEDIVGKDSNSKADQSNSSYGTMGQNSGSCTDLNGNNSRDYRKVNKIDFANVEPGWTLVVDAHKPMKKWKSCDVLNSSFKNTRNRQNGMSNYSVWKRGGNVRGNRFWNDGNF